MDKLTYHKNLLAELVHEWGNFGSTLEPKIDTVIIADHVSGNYILMSVGWRHHKRIHFIVFHARLHDGKIWIEKDNIDPSITEELLQRGVPREDVVFGWNLPPERAMMERAAGD